MPTFKVTTFNISNDKRGNSIAYGPFTFELAADKFVFESEDCFGITPKVSETIPYLSLKNEKYEVVWEMKIKKGKK